jgi:hypothetical protein
MKQWAQVAHGRCWNVSAASSAIGTNLAAFSANSTLLPSGNAGGRPSASSQPPASPTTPQASEGIGASSTNATNAVEAISNAPQIARGWVGMGRIATHAVSPTACPGGVAQDFFHPKVSALVAPCLTH